MLGWLRNCLKNKYVKAVLYLIGLGLIALWLEIPLNAVASIFLIILWLGYIYLAIKKSTILLPKEKKIVHFCLLVLAALALSTVRSFKEILTLLVLMATQGNIAILFWFKTGKSFWATALAHAAIATIGLLVIYATADLIKSHGERHAPAILVSLWNIFKKWLAPFKIKFQKITQERHLKSSFRETREIIQFINESRKIVQKSYKAKLAQWIDSKKLIWIFFIYLLPIPLPYLPAIIIVTIRYRNIQHGLWPLLIASFIKGIIFVWLVWQGLIRI